LNQQRLAKLRIRESQVKAQIEKLESQIKSRQSKEETRRKILVGAALLSAVQAGEIEREFLASLIDRKITRKGDRELFGIDGMREISE
jgi:septal ring factor EnvC (AmiA/AmiB activator)